MKASAFAFLLAQIALAPHITPAVAIAIATFWFAAAMVALFLERKA